MITDASGVTSSLSAPPGGFATALEIALGEQAGVTALLFHATPLDWQRRSAEIEATRPALASLKVQLLSTGVLPWLAAQLHSAAPINLLQGDYQQRRGGTAQWQRWRLAATLAAVLLGLHLGVQGFRLWSLDRSERELDTQDCRTTPQAYQVTMPKKPSNWSGGSAARQARGWPWRAYGNFGNGRSGSCTPRHPTPR